MVMYPHKNNTLVRHLTTPVLSPIPYVVKNAGYDMVIQAVRGISSLSFG